VKNEDHPSAAGIRRKLELGQSQLGEKIHKYQPLQSAHSKGKYIYKYFTAHFTIVACRFQEVKRDILSAPASSKISFISPKTKSIR